MRMYSCASTAISKWWRCISHLSTRLNEYWLPSVIVMKGACRSREVTVMHIAVCCYYCISVTLTSLFNMALRYQLVSGRFQEYEAQGCYPLGIRHHYFFPCYLAFLGQICQAGPPSWFPRRSGSWPAWRRLPPASRTHAAPPGMRSGTPPWWRSLPSHHFKNEQIFQYTDRVVRKHYQIYHNKHNTYIFLWNFFLTVPPLFYDNSIWQLSRIQSQDYFHVHYEHLNVHDFMDNPIVLLQQIHTGYCPRTTYVQ